MRDRLKTGLYGLKPWLDLRAAWVPLLLLADLWLLHRFVDWQTTLALFRGVVTLECALLGVWVWRGVALAPPAPRRHLGRWRGGPLMAGAWLAAAWTLVWLLLPAWGLLRAVGLALFAPVMAWRWWRAGRRSLAAGAWLGWCLGGCKAALLVLARPFGLERTLHAVWPVEPDRHGAHFEWSRLMEALAALSPTGGGWSAVPPVLTRVDDAGWLLRVGIGFGWVPMAVLGCALVLWWWSVGAYVARSPVGRVLSLRSRRLGVALALFHALAAAFYAAWSVGYLYRPMGALAPLAHVGWSVLTLALFVIVWRAWRQRRVSVGSALSDAPHADEKGSLWRSGWALAGLGWIVLSFVGAMSFPARVAAWEEAWLEQANRYRPPPRVEIADRTGEHLLASNVLAYDVWIHPAEFWAASWANPLPAAGGDTGPTDAARETALLDALAPWPLVARMARERLSVQDRSAAGPVRLLWAQPKEIVDAVRTRLDAAGLGGIDVNSRWTRHYSEGALTAHAIGFTSLSTEGYGQEGLEMALDRQLRASPGSQRDLGPLRSSLDLTVQRLADGALRAAIQHHGASVGALMVIDVATSEVRALVSAPGFDPNEPGSYRYPLQPERILNQALARPVALGALLTPLLVADLLQRGELQPDAVIALEGERGLRVGGATLKDVDPVERAALTDIVARSSNIGMAKLALRMSETQLRTLMDRSGLHGPGGMTGLVGAAFSKPDWAAWPTDLQANAGQNLSTTLARAVQAYVPIANGGIDRRLSLLVTDERWRVQNTLSSVPARRVLSEQTACELRRMLHAATGVTGTAPLAQVLGVSVAGKTATGSQLPVAEEGGRMRHLPQSDALFIGMAPAEKPRYLIGVQLGFADGRPHWGGQVAAPVFAQVVRGLFPSPIPSGLPGEYPCLMPETDSRLEEAIR